MRGGYGLEHNPQGSNCLSASLILDGRKTICLLTIHINDSGRKMLFSEDQCAPVGHNCLCKDSADQVSWSHLC
jgi:hypothetical protein